MVRAIKGQTPAPAWSGIAQARFRSPVSRGRHVPGKAVGAFVPGLTKKAFEKFGFSTATLIMDWPRIAGADLSQWTTPERVKWPQGVDKAATSEDGHAQAGATLILRVDPARALDVEYRARQILERINAYFGYRAVAELRLLQAPITSRPPAQAAKPAASTPRTETASYGDDPLGQALARLESGMLRKKAAAGV